MKKFFILLLLQLSYCAFMQAHAEGSKDLMADTSSRSALCTNNGLFAGYNSTVAGFRRLNIHIANTTEKIFLGFSLGYSTGVSQILGEGSTSTPQYFFRILDPSGNVVFGPQSIKASNAIPTGIAGFNQVKAGPSAIVGAAGYTAFEYLPLTTGDYYIEFNKDSTTYSASQCSFDYWDITVANNSGTSPVAINGRIWSQQWGFYSKDYVTGGGYSGVFKGIFYSYTSQGIVNKINFNNADFRGGSFIMGMNNSGPGTTGNYTEDRKSVSLQAAVGTEYKIFLNNPDINEYPTGDATIPAFTMSDPILHCGASSLDINYHINRAGTTQFILDFDSNGVYDKNSRDIVLSKRTAAGNQTIAWDRIDGLGNYVDSLTILMVRILSEYQLGVHHISFDDIEILSNGFTVEQIRPILKAGLEDRFYWDDSKIFAGPGLNVPYKTGPQPNVVELMGAPVRKWDNFTDNSIVGFGNKNSINTWWNLYEIKSVNRITVMPCTTLPVSLISFSISKSNDHAQLNWKVTSESNLDTYEIEKSTDGINFSKIGNINATNQNVSKTYNFIDGDVLASGKTFYRLKLMDKSGSFIYSDVLSIIHSSPRIQINISPNPFTDRLKISLPEDWTSKKISVNIISVTGALVLEQQVTVGGNSIELVDLKIRPGTYFIKITNGKEIKVSSILRL